MARPGFSPKKRVGQFEEEIAGLESQRAAKDREIALIREELGSVRQLWDKKLVQRSRLLELERFETRLTGERGELVAATGQARGRITEAELAIIQIDHDLRSEVARELRDAEAQAAELEERRVAAEQQLRQTLVRAPQGGRVHELAVHTIGGVVAAGEPIMRIVPSGDELTVEARVAPQDIDQVRAGQPAFLRLSAFNQQTTPELEGRVLAVSPDLVTDRASGASFFVVRIGIDDREAASGLEQGLTPGMPVEVFLRTSDRTVLSYLLKPVSDQVSRAFRE
jgi:HlyD family secretion protein